MSKIELAIQNDSERNDSFYFDTIDDVKVFRVTGIEMALKCGRAWQLEFLRGNRGGSKSNNIYSQVGSIIHLLCEDHVSRVALQKPVLTPEEIYMAISFVSESSSQYKDEVANFDKYRSRLSEHIKGCEILGLEQNLLINENPRVEGQVDLLMRKNNRIILLDHKTHRRPQPKHYWKNKFQFAAYTYAVYLKYGVEEVDWIVGLPNLDQDVTFTLQVSHDFPDMINKAVANIRESKKEVSDICKYCREIKECAEYEKIENYRSSLKEKLESFT